jgi:large subunit ribosomal protein L9
MSQTLVLRADVSGVGHRGDIVEVSSGYARNYLLPRGLAFVATPGSQEQAEAMQRRRQLKDAKDREEAQEIARRLVSTKISVSGRAAEGGRLFGSITVADIVAAVAKQANVELDRKSIHLAEHIRDLGEHQINVRLHAAVEFPLTLEVSGS